MHDAGKRREFKAFQRSFLTVALLAMFSDWIQGPYSYALYAFYGFEQGDIAMLYMGGFLSSMVGVVRVWGGGIPYICYIDTVS